MIALLLAALLAAPVPCPNPARSRAVIERFKAANPCPKSCATYTRVGRAFVLFERCGACEVDHRCPLACCGSDTIDNLQWLPKRENRAKGADCTACEVSS